MAISGIVTMIAAGIGFIAVMILNAFVLDEFDAYGEVPIPGSGQVQLPAGEVEVSFHTLVTGSPSSGFPLPPLELSIIPPEGVPDPVLAEKRSGTTTVNSDTHMRVWVAQIPAEGTYQVRTDGQVNGYINPRLAFGHQSSYDYLHWVFGALFGVGLLDLILSRFLAKRLGRGQPEVALQEAPPLFPGRAPPTYPYAPTDQGVRLEQLKTLAALRDSGALTQAEFEQEKRRILKG